ncbi:hypothetical protein BDA96_08G151000 [Sorghum bicolor]|uniref:Uncharacterized protein n=1 Tax=Sorghum bicolor TaxID=4558 RepID=A0A921QG13_SORBI|nr:hypothetical protein BDA96_08G151000 [Sorghum bicolor]
MVFGRLESGLAGPHLFETRKVYLPSVVYPCITGYRSWLRTPLVLVHNRSCCVPDFYF